MKMFVKAMDRTGDDFKYLETKFSRICHAKIKEDIFLGPQICEVLNDEEENGCGNLYVAFWKTLYCRISKTICDSEKRFLFLKSAHQN